MTGRRGPTAAERQRGFEEWWAEYPKKVNKKKARQEWERACGEESLETRFEALRAQKATARGAAGIFPDPHRYIRDRRWTDDIQAWDDVGSMPDRVQAREAKLLRELQAPGYRAEAPEFDLRARLAILAQWLPEIPGREAWAQRIQLLEGNFEAVQEALMVVEKEVLSAFHADLQPDVKTEIKTSIEKTLGAMRARQIPAEVIERERPKIGRRVLLKRMNLPDGLNLFHRYPDKNDAVAAEAFMRAAQPEDP